MIYILKNSSKVPLHIQLFKCIKDDILNNYEVGQKLPSIRKLAQEYNISKTTVQTAFSQLYAEGFIDSKPRSGYYVCDFLYNETSKSINIQSESVEKKESPTYDFFPARLRSEDFPLKTWKRVFNKAIDEGVDFGSYGDGQGEIELRKQVTSYLTSSRGVKCLEEQVVICAGFSDSMSILAKLLHNKHSTFAMEEPGYHVAKKVFEEYNYKVVKIKVTKDGIDLESLKKSNSSLVYITPSHQYPTGVTMPIAQRLKLIKEMVKRDGYIIEDDYDSELAYYNRPIPSLQGLDTNNTVVYLGTFAKSLSPALRVSYMVLPPKLLELYKNNYDFHFPRVSITTQKTLALFMKDGYWQKHLRKIRTLNKKKHNLLKELLQKHLKSTFTIEAQGAGLAILINPRVEFDWEKFKKLSDEKNIKLYFAKERSGGDFEAIRMGFGGFLLEEITPAVKAFSEIWYMSIG